MTPSTTSDAPDERSWAFYTAPSFIDVDGSKTAYRREGEGATILFLHGSSITRAWLPFHASLAQSHDLVAPEHPGFGDSPMPPTLDDMHDYVLHYDALIEQLELDRVHLVGQGFGGWIAAELSVFYPRRFQSLTLVTPLGLGVADRVAPIGNDFFRLEPGEIVDAMVNGRSSRFADHFQQEGSPGDQVQAFAEKTSLAKVAWNPRYDRKLDYRLQRLIAPTLVLAAEQDRMSASAVAGRYAELIPDARYATVRGADGEPSAHLLTVDQADKTAELITEHVAAHGDRSKMGERS